MQQKQLKQYLLGVISDELGSNDQGILLSKRVGLFDKSSVDDNLFYTLSSWLLLKDSSYTDLAKKLEMSCEKNLHKYQNKFGRTTYNFWKTTPYEQWPNHSIFSQYKKFWIPDDLDCTALTYLLKSREAALEMRNEIAPYYTAKSENRGFYTTWFGPKMPEEFDICACANYLYLLCNANIEFNQNDWNTWRYILDQVKEKTYIKDPFGISPNYQTTSIIIFHLARLLSMCEMKEDGAVIHQLINEIKAQLKQADQLSDEVLLSLALNAIGEPLNQEKAVDFERIEEFLQTFSFFSAPIVLSSSSKLLKRVAKSNALNIKFVNRGFNSSLLLKYYSISK